jgi:glycosyltransferase involved in cell wall biosynthesis
MSYFSWPRITVITPSYNQAAFLELTIRSVLDQQYPNLQYGVVDGNSTDGSIAIIERYRSQLDFAIIEDDNGQVEAINKGLNRADGEIVCYLNSDDTLLPDSLYQVGRYFADYLDHDWLIGDCALIDADSNLLRHLSAHAATSLAHILIRKDALHLPQPSIFWRRKLLDRFGLFNPDYHFAFDFDMWCRFLSGNVAMYQLDEELASYRIH